MVDDDLSLPSIYFAYGDATIAHTNLRLLETAALTIMSAPDETFRIIGNSDGYANEQYNLELARLRAEAVKAYLVDNYDIDAGILQIETMQSSERNRGRNPLARRSRAVVKRAKRNGRTKKVSVKEEQGGSG